MVSSISFAWIHIQLFAPNKILEQQWRSNPFAFLIHIGILVPFLSSMEMWKIPFNSDAIYNAQKRRKSFISNQFSIGTISNRKKCVISPFLGHFEIFPHEKICTELLLRAHQIKHIYIEKCGHDFILGTAAAVPRLCMWQVFFCCCLLETLNNKLQSELLNRCRARVCAFVCAATVTIDNTKTILRGEKSQWNRRLSVLNKRQMCW